MIDKIDELFKKAQEVEFSIVNNQVYILQSRSLVFSNKNKKNEFIKENFDLIGNAKFGSYSGIVSGNVCFEDPNENSILCINELNPSEIKSLIKARCILSKKGDHNSHIAVLCRLLNKPYLLSANLNKNLDENNLLYLDTNNLKIYYDYKK